MAAPALEETQTPTHVCTHVWRAPPWLAAASSARSASQVEPALGRMQSEESRGESSEKNSGRNSGCDGDAGPGAVHSKKKKKKKKKKPSTKKRLSKHDKKKRKREQEGETSAPGAKFPRTETAID